MTPLDLHCKADAVLRVCIDRMTRAGVPESDQAEWIERELLYLTERAVDFQRARHLADQSLARKATDNGAARATA